MGECEVGGIPIRQEAKRETCSGGLGKSQGEENKEWECGRGVKTPRQWVETSRYHQGNSRLDFLHSGFFVCLFVLIWFGLVHRAWPGKFPCLLERSHGHYSTSTMGTYLSRWAHHSSTCFLQPICAMFRIHSLLCTPMGGQKRRE